MIIVTGASRGIGRAVADRLVSQGEEVLGLARTSVSADFEILPIDVSSAEDVREVARSLRGRKTKVSALINAAGIAAMNLALMTPSGSARKIVETNLLGTIFSSQAFAPLIIRAGGGAIVNFSTIAVALALQGEAVYAASKAGVEAFSRTLARELGSRGVTVNCVAPGPIQTDLIKGISERQLGTVIQGQILRRQFTVADVCDVVEVLLDARSRSLTGHVLHIGGV